MEGGDLGVGPSKGHTRVTSGACPPSGLLLELPQPFQHQLPVLDDPFERLPLPYAQGLGYGDGEHGRRGVATGGREVVP
jgi:hypothetical protein